MHQRVAEYLSIGVQFCPLELRVLTKRSHVGGCVDEARAGSVIVVAAFEALPLSMMSEW